MLTMLVKNNVLRSIVTEYFFTIFSFFRVDAFFCSCIRLFELRNLYLLQSKEYSLSTTESESELDDGILRPEGSTSENNANLSPVREEVFRPFC